MSPDPVTVAAAIAAFMALHLAGENLGGSSSDDAQSSDDDDDD